MTMDSKSTLEKLSKKQEVELMAELNRLSEKGSKVVSNVLIITGGLVLAYAIFKVIVNDPPVKKKNKPGISTQTINSPSRVASLFSEITHTLAEEAVLFLLDLARERLVSYLNATNESPR